jgi:hypothetical protein
MIVKRCTLHRIASRSRKQGSGHGVQTDDWGPASVPKIERYGRVMRFLRHARVRSSCEICLSTYDCKDFTRTITPCTTD